MTAADEIQTKPALTLFGPTKAQATRAIKWLRDRSILAFWDGAQHALCAFETKYGAAWTEKQLRDAYEATRLVTK